MKTTLRFLALAGVLAAGGAVLLRNALPPRLIFRSPGQSSESTDAAGLTIRGRVIYDGLGVAGARVKAIPHRPHTREAMITSPVTRQAETDENGRFELIGVPEGPARLAVVADRLAVSISTLDVRSDVVISDLTIVLDPGVTLESRVSVGAAVVPGARVSVRLVGHDSFVERRPLRESVTDAEGRFRMDGLDPERPLRLVILAEGHRPFEETLKSPLDVTERIDLEPGLNIKGRVVDATGGPVAGVEVHASQGEGYTAVARSTSSGDVVMGGLISRPVTLRVQADGYAPAKLELPNLSDGWTLTLRKNGGVAGRAPAGSWLVIETASATFRRPVGGDGLFRWDGLPAGPAVARATDRKGRVIAVKSVEIPEGESADGILLLP